MRIGASRCSQCDDEKTMVGNIRNDVGQQEKVERKLAREKKSRAKERAYVKGANSGLRCKYKQKRIHLAGEGHALETGEKVSKSNHKSDQYHVNLALKYDQFKETVFK